MDTRRIPSLDGLRALAILMVITLHLSQRFGFPDLQTKTGAFIFVLSGLGGDGVGLFFVLSGFLITSLLLAEFDATGRIDLGGFYLRRTFRILPPLYAYLAFVIIFCFAIDYPLHVSTIAGSALFYRNYFPTDGQWLTEHTWSLCVEEQFYLLWPIAFIWALHRGGRPTAARLAAVLILLAPILRMATKMSHLQIFDHRLPYLLHSRMDALMCGCLAALLVTTPRFELFYAKVARVWWLLPLQFLFLSGFLTAFIGSNFSINYRNSIGYTIDSASIAMFIVWAARNEHSWVGKILNSRLITQIGILSYSAYLWQTFFIHEDNPTWVNRMPWGFVFIWIAALLSYNLVEQPALRLRKRIRAALILGRTTVA